jgi:general secretion pathway protein C
MEVRRWHVAAVNGILLAAAAYLAGASIGQLFGVRDDDDAVRPGRPGASVRNLAGEAPPRSQYDVIVARDILRTSLAPPELVSALRLVGIAADLPAQFAVIEDGRTRTQGLYRVGDRVPLDDEGQPGDVLTLVRIEPGRVVLARRGSEFALARTEPPATQIASATPAGPVRDAARIRRTRADEYVLDRRDLRASLSDLDRVSRQIRAIPNFVDGHANGYRVFGIDSGSLFATLGLRNGDVVRRVNAVDLTDPGVALAAFQDLPSERRVTLDISRREQAKTLTYEIR